MNQKELEEILKESLAIEEKGHKLYLESAERITNSLGRKMLKRLANDERTHMKRIREIYESLTKNTLNEVELEEPHLEVFKDIFNRMREQVDEAVDDLTEVGVDDSEIINVAMELEAHSRFFYEEAADKATDETIKKFYSSLAVEEKGHMELLQETNNYLSNPSLFFGMDYH